MAALETEKHARKPFISASDRMVGTAGGAEIPFPRPQNRSSPYSIAETFQQSPVYLNTLGGTPVSRWKARAKFAGVE